MTGMGVGVNLRGGNDIKNVFPCQHRATLKGKYFLPILSFKSRLISKRTGCTANRKSLKLFPFVNMVEKLPSLSIPLNAERLH